MSFNFKQETSCLSLITKSWTHWSLFDLRKKMFKSIHSMSNSVNLLMGPTMFDFHLFEAKEWCLSLIKNRSTHSNLFEVLKITKHYWKCFSMQQGLGFGYPFCNLSSIQILHVCWLAKVQNPSWLDIQWRIFRVLNPILRRDFNY